nr:hypothetical protein [Tanacetum cinerariifolium]
MATTLDQQIALDEALVPSAQRLRIGRSNFQLPSDIQSKEPTLQVVYDVLLTGADLEVGTDLVAGTDLEAGTDLVKEAGPDLVTQAGINLVTLSDRSSAIVRTRSKFLSGTDLRYCQDPI